MGRLKHVQRAIEHGLKSTTSASSPPRIDGANGWLGILAHTAEQAPSGSWHHPGAGALLSAVPGNRATLGGGARGGRRCAQIGWRTAYHSSGSTHTRDTNAPPLRTGTSPPPLAAVAPIVAQGARARPPHPNGFRGAGIDGAHVTCVRSSLVTKGSAAGLQHSSDLASWRTCSPNADQRSSTHKFHFDTP